MKHTYELIEAIISKGVRVQNEKKKRNEQIVNIRKPLPCVPFSLFFRLAKSRPKVFFFFLQLIRKLTMKRIIFAKTTYHQNK